MNADSSGADSGGRATAPTVLEEAAALINGDRQEQYGNATESHQRIADLWAAYLNTDVTEFDVVNMMVLLKVSRTRNTYHRDSYVDIAGYAGLGERLYDESGDEPDSYTFEVTQDGQPWLILTEDDPETVREIRVSRVWEALSDIPPGVTVADKDGNFWLPDEISTTYHHSEWSPYTEVLEGTA